MTAESRAFAERWVEINAHLNSLYAELTYCTYPSDHFDRVTSQIAKAWLDKRACAVDWRNSLSEAS